jgi:isopenicillin N synthase-like dioxygenase
MPPVTRIPIIDLPACAPAIPWLCSAWRREIHEACTTIGFFYIINHGVPQAVDRCRGASSSQLLRVPGGDEAARGGESAASRLQCTRRRHHVSGKTARLQGNFSASDWNCRRTIPMCWPVRHCAARTTGRTLCRRCVPALYGYYEAVAACGADLLRAVAVGLGVDEQFSHRAIPSGCSGRRWFTIRRSRRNRMPTSSA